MNQNTREKMKLHALRLFSCKGYDAVGVQEIVDACEVSKPTLYHHFQNKLGLLSALLEDELTPLLTSLENLNPTADFEQDLCRCGLAISEFARDQPELYRLFLCLMFAPPESSQFIIAVSYAKRQFSVLENIFIHHQSRLNNDTDNETSIHAANFQGLLNNIITLFLHGHIQLHASFVYRVVHRFIYGVYGV
jgi:TetR/AcrR family transcriptional regulator